MFDYLIITKQKLICHSKYKIKIQYLRIPLSFKYTINAFLLVLRSRTMVNPNSWYIVMHLDRLNQELLDGYGKQVEGEPQKKKQQSKYNTEINKIKDNHGL